MRKRILLVAVLALVMAVPGQAQKTPDHMVKHYNVLADAILALNEAETQMVVTIISRHFRAAEVSFNQAKYEEAAAQMALFANEGDNAVGGIRKRLVEGGHNHNSAGEQAGIYDTGFVVVTKKVKRQVLAAASELRQATDPAFRQAAWDKFAAAATSLIGND